METKATEFIYAKRISKQQKFDKRLIAHIVVLAEQGVPRRDLIEQYGMANSTLQEWMNKYGSGKARQRSYTVSQKRSVCRSVESGMSVKQAQIAFGISCPSLIRRWIREFKEENTEISVTQSLEMARKTVNPPPDADIKALQKALEEANLKIQALDTMIDIAQDQLKIDIRKKSGARQSSK